MRPDWYRRSIFFWRSHGSSFLCAGPCGTGPRSGPAAHGDDPKAESRTSAEDQAYQDLARQVAELERFSQAFEAIAKLVGPTVVHIQSKRAASFMDRNFTYEETGSGVIVRLPGYDVPYVVTNHHVVEKLKPEQLLITSADGRVLHATRIWGDRDSDIAVVAISELDVATARLGDSDKLQIGHWVLAIGSPFDLAGSITHGIVSGKGRRSLKLGQTPQQGVLNQDFIQTDAPINPGNSGGPLVNLRGEVVAINTAIASQSGGSEGVGFSIPVNLVRRIARELIEKGAVTRAYLGIGFDPPLDARMAMKLGLPRYRGAIVQEVFPDTPATEAGLESLDVILEFNGRPVEDNEHLTHLISMTPVGQEVALKVWHHRQEKKVVAKLADRSQGKWPSAKQAEPVPRLGIAVRELSDSHRRQLGMTTERGLVVVNVTSHSPSAQVIEPFDIIEQVDGRPTSTPAELIQAVRGRGEEGVRVRILRPTPQGPTPIEAVLKPS